MTERPRNWAQARADIDRGETGDKIAHEDPATAPLGTDAEAGGESTPSEAIARAGDRQDPAARAGRRRHAPAIAPGACHGWCWAWRS